MTKQTKDSILSRTLVRPERSLDRLFIAVVIILAAYGSIMVFSAGYAYAAFRYEDGLYFVKRQAIWLILGIIAMLVVSRIDVNLLKKHTVKAYCLTLVLLGLTLVIGFVGNGAQRWRSSPQRLQSSP